MVDNADRALVSITNLVKRFAGQEILRRVSLDVADSEVIALIGPSGSGKTTLLRCVQFLEEFEEGEITIAGEEVGYKTDGRGRRHRRSEREIAAIRADVGMVFQSFNLFPHLDVLSNITLAPIRVRGTQRGEAESDAIELLKRVGLAEKARAYPAQLSGGQQQRVAVARALAMRPKIVLFDEPTSALDPELVDEVLGTIKDLTADGMTMMLVTHEMQFARDVADRVVFMTDGQIVEQGAPKVMFETPSTDRLKAFLRRHLGATR